MGSLSRLMVLLCLLAMSIVVACGSYEYEVLYSHNVHRANHTWTSKLTYDHTLAAYATTLAKRCVFAHDISIGGGNYGQNLGSSGSTGASEKSKNRISLVKGAINNQWYNGEISLFLPSYYGKPTPDMTNFEKWGHFTQVVWRDTKRVGCATHYCAKGSKLFPSPYSGWITVCNYAPPGNVMGQFDKNVGRPFGHDTFSR